MPDPGSEERLLTLYADIHYCFSEPSPRPAQHRFDKESYVYLYRDKVSGRGRLEVANHAGTPEQDAFTGYLDDVIVHQTFRHPNLCTLTVNGSEKSSQPDNHWRLPSTDPRDEGNYMFRLHTLDLYFWTEADAAQFVHAVASTLRQEQLKVDNPPAVSPAPHAQPMSPVVQNLENMAISQGSSDKTRAQQPPRWQQQQTQSNVSQQKDAATVPGVAAAAATMASASQGKDRSVYTEQPISPQSPHSLSDQQYTPLAYNPAAPPAPEKHAHRERTPPPPEGTEGTGLAAAAARDEGRNPPQRSGPSFGPKATPSFGPGASSTISMSGVQSPVGSAHGSQAYTPTPSSYSPMPSNISSPPISPSSQTSRAASAFPGPPQRTTTDQSIGSLGGKTEQTPTNEILGPDFRHSSVPLQHLQPQYPDYLAQRVSQNTPPSTHSPDYHVPGQRPPHGQKLPDNVRIGGYSDYSYTSPPPQPPPGGGYHDGNPYQTGDYAIHQQVYRPTEEEASGHGSHGRRSSKPKTQDERPGRLEAGAEKVEKKVNRFLRGIEKRIG